ncbi:CpaF family protein [Amycolatopsis sp. WAC 04197]|uniref:CpaF family protein n=1 Tax=Amycolatopsis sp. WAC 04197 TaxID=2203199 RepID=UPI000F77ADEA|nr:ATPase, T2SS/T4P/T4SS family [Amycolatopsis sp. WAC 04197]RSN45127.1 CpaF family protein [Amycolatopsis sp. WAC 04197]
MLVDDQSDVDELVDRVQQELARQVEDEMSRHSDGAEPEGFERALAGRLIDEVLSVAIKERAGRGKPFLDPGKEWFVKRSVMAEMFGLGRLEPLLADEGIENIDIIGNEPVWLSYSDGTVMRAPRIAPSDEALLRWLQRVAARYGRTEHSINSTSPLLNMELPGGERLAATVEVTDRPHISIRRHRLSKTGLEDLRQRGMISTAQLALLRAAVRAEKNVVVCGRQRAGKTTLLRALCWEIPPDERFATLETEFELGLHRHRDRFPAVVAFEERARTAEGIGGNVAGLSQLVWQSLRMHTTRTIVGEVRGREIIPMLDALSTGGSGSLSTLHARNAGDAVNRMARLCLEGNSAWTPELAHETVAHAIDLIVHIDLLADGGSLDRYVAQVVSVEAGEYGRPARTYLFDRTKAPDRCGARRSVPTGNVPTDIEDYERAGFDRNWLTCGSDGEWIMPPRGGGRDA